MYVNTLITLQENMPTYTQPGKTLIGHVTLMSPGWIKCYIQNLKPATDGSVYTFYIFSKAKRDGIRLGKLSQQKETKWIIDENNIENSGLTLEEIDGACIVEETQDNKADAVASGFKNDRYIIMPIIESILRKLNASKAPEKAESNVAPTPMPAVKEEVESKVDAIEEKVEPIVDTVKEEVESIVDDVKEEVEPEVEDVEEEVEPEVEETVETNTEEILEDDTPIEVIKEQVEPQIKELLEAQGIDANQEEIQKVLEAEIEKVKNNKDIKVSMLKDLMKELKGKIEPKAAAAKEALEKLGSKVEEAKETVEKVESKVDNAEEAVEKVETTAETIENVIDGKVKPTLKAVETALLIETAIEAAKKAVKAKKAANQAKEVETPLAEVTTDTPITEVEADEEVVSENAPAQDDDIAKKICSFNLNKENKSAIEETIINLIKELIQKPIKTKEEQEVAEAIEEVAELEIVATTLKDDEEEDKNRVVEDIDAVIYQNQQHLNNNQELLESVEGIEAIEDIEANKVDEIEEEPLKDARSAKKADKKGITPEDVLRLITQVNSDKELKEKLSAFGKQLKNLGQFVTNRDEEVRNIKAPEQPSPLAQPLDKIEELVGYEFEPKTTTKGNIRSEDTTPRQAVNYILSQTKQKNKQPNYIDKIEKKIEDIQQRRDQGMKG